MNGRATGAVSEEMLALYEAQRRAHDNVLTLQSQIEEEEAVYLEETPHGNIIRGWDGFIDSKQPRKDANPKKIKPYSESEHLFSNCCFYSEMAGEPNFTQVDIYDTRKGETPSRRKLTVTLSVGKGAGASGSISGVVDSVASHNAPAAYRGGKGATGQKTAKIPTHPPTGKGATTASYQLAKLKKRKRELEAATAATATAKAHEMVLGGPQVVAPTVIATANAAAPAPEQPPASDFLDVL